MTMLNKMLKEFENGSWDAICDYTLNEVRKLIKTKPYRINDDGTLEVQFPDCEWAVCARKIK